MFKNHTLISMKDSNITTSTDPISLSRQCSERTELRIPDYITVLDISLNKRVIAYLVEQDEEDTCWRIEVYQVDSSLNTQKLYYSCCIPNAISESMVEFENYFTFLSLSSRGKHVALSFFVMDEYGRPNYERGDEVEYMVFKRCPDSTQGVLQKQGRFNGRAVFLDDRKLALISMDKIKVLDHNFSMDYLLDISNICGYMPIKFTEDLIHNYMWWRGNDSDDILNRTSGKNLIAITRYSQYGILTTMYQENVTRVWLISDGSLLTSFKTDDKEDIMAISKYRQQIATYHKKSCVINIYNVRSGLIVNKFKPRKRRSKDVEILSLVFSEDGKTLMMIAKESDVGDEKHSETLVYECWNIAVEKSILFHRGDSFRSEEQRKAILPFIVKYAHGGNERENAYQVIYMNEMSSDQYYPYTVHRFLFSLDGTSTEYGWNKVDHLVNYNDRNDGHELMNALDDYQNMLCYTREIVEKDSRSPSARNSRLDYFASSSEELTPMTGDEELNVITLVLRFGAHTVQLWRRNENARSDDIKNHELVFIRAHKPPIYNSKQCFTDTMSLDLSRPSEQLIRFMAICDGRIQIRFYQDDSKYTQEEIFLPMERFQNLYNVDAMEIENFCQIESVCNALHYLQEQSVRKHNYSDFDHDKKEGARILYAKTIILVRDEIDNLLNRQSRYFSTLSGSNTMAMLASFADGQGIIQEVFIQTKIPINIFSYKGKNLYENVLTVLIEQNNIPLVHYLFNKIILDSQFLGPGIFAVIVDTLLYLQSKGNIDLLLKFTQKLSYIPVNDSSYPVLAEELKDHDMEEAIDSSLRKLQTYSTVEEVPKFNRLNYIWYKLKAKERKKQFLESISPFFSWVHYLRVEYKPKVACALCIIPLPYFNSYYRHYDDDNEGIAEERKMIWRKPKELKEEEDVEGIREIAKPKERYMTKSSFVQNASSEYRNQIFKQGDTIIEVMLTYKWKKFGFKAFSIVMIIHLIYYFSFLAAISFPIQWYGYVPGEVISHPQQVLATALMFASFGIVLLQEMRQFYIFSKREYFASFYNWIDLATYSLTLASFIQLRYDHEYRLQVGSVTILMLWIHAMLRLRIIGGFGVTLEIIIQLFKKILPILLIMLMVVIAFTHSFIYLLQDQEDGFFQDSFAVDPDGLGLAANADSASNPFVNVFRAFSVLWFFLFGVWDPIVEGDVGDDTMTIILSILFSFITVVIFLNIVIAIMSNTVEKMTEEGNSVWLSHFAAVLSEIEMLWCFESQRHNRKNNPNFIYYFGSKKDIVRQSALMEQETEELLIEMEKKRNK